MARTLSRRAGPNSRVASSLPRTECEEGPTRMSDLRHVRGGCCRTESVSRPDPHSSPVAIRQDARQWDPVGTYHVGPIQPRNAEGSRTSGPQSHNDASWGHTPKHRQPLKWRAFVGSAGTVASSSATKPTALTDELQLHCPCPTQFGQCTGWVVGPRSCQSRPDCPLSMPKESLSTRRLTIFFLFGGTCGPVGPSPRRSRRVGTTGRLGRSGRSTVGRRPRPDSGRRATGD
jgi:hypothetical protein